MNTETAALLKDLYMIAVMQEDLGQQELSLVVDWAVLRSRLNGALLREGLEVPTVPETEGLKGG